MCFFEARPVLQQFCYFLKMLLAVSNTQDCKQRRSKKILPRKPNIFGCLATERKWDSWFGAGRSSHVGSGGVTLSVLLFPSLSRRKWPLFLNILPLCWDCGSDVGLTQAVLTSLTLGAPTSTEVISTGSFFTAQRAQPGSTLLPMLVCVVGPTNTQALLKKNNKMNKKLFIMLSFHGGSDLFLLLTQTRLKIIQTTSFQIYTFFSPSKLTFICKMT